MEPHGDKGISHIHAIGEYSSMYYWQDRITVWH